MRVVRAKSLVVAGLKPALGMAFVLLPLLQAQNERPLGAAKASLVQSVRVQSLEQSTKVVIQISGNIDYKSDRIENPARVFVDLQNTIPALLSNTDGSSSRRMQAIAVGDKLLRQVRLAENQRGLTRLVFDLAQEEVEFKLSVLSSPNRLLVEFRGTGKGGVLRNPLAQPPSGSTTISQQRQEPRKAPLPPPTLRPPAKAYVFPDPPQIQASARFPKLDGVLAPQRGLASPLAKIGVTRQPNPYIPEKSAKGRVEVSVQRQAPPGESPAVAASRLSAGKQSLTRVLGLKVGRVVIDAGHGGHDVGSVGPTGLTEKEVVLDIAKRLGALVEERLGSEVIFTRDGDTFIPLEQRPEIANRSRADLFVSIHANSSTTASATGVETYYLNFTSSPEALEVAARENASSERSVSDLGELIKKIALKDKIDESREFAAKVQSALFSSAARGASKVRDRGVRKAPFVVLIGASMPSILTEIGFLSNPREEAQLRKPEYRQKIAEALYKGVSQYAGTLSHFSMARTGMPGEN